MENGIHSAEHGTLLTPGNIERMVAAHTWLVLTTTILFHPEGIEHGDGQVPEIMSKLTSAREYMTGNLAALRESRADFVVLGGDPFDDIRAVHQVEQVYRSGQCVVAEDHVRPLSLTGG